MSMSTMVNYRQRTGVRDVGMEKLLSAVPDLARIFMISMVVDAMIWLSLAEFQSILLTDPYTLLALLAATFSIVWIISAIVRRGRSISSGASAASKQYHDRTTKKAKASKVRV
jgi:hypothetical protein